MQSDRSKWMGHFSNVEQGRDGGASDTSDVSNSAKTVTSLQRSAKNKSPVTHSDHRKREKWALSTQTTRSLSHQHLSQSGKVCGALLVFCCVFVCVSCFFPCLCQVCVYMWNTLGVFMSSAYCMWIFHMCVCVKEIMPVCVFTWVSANWSTERALVILCVNSAECLFSPFSSPLSPLVLCIVSHCQSAH